MYVHVYWKAFISIVHKNGLSHNKSTKYSSGHSHAFILNEKLSVKCHFSKHKKAGSSSIMLFNVYKIIYNTYLSLIHTNL